MAWGILLAFPEGQGPFYEQTAGHMGSYPLKYEWGLAFSVASSLPGVAVPLWMGRRSRSRTVILLADIAIAAAILGAFWTTGGPDRYCRPTSNLADLIFGLVFLCAPALVSLVATGALLIRRDNEAYRFLSIPVSAAALMGLLYYITANTCPGQSAEIERPFFSVLWPLWMIVTFPAASIGAACGMLWKRLRSRRLAAKSEASQG